MPIELATLAPLIGGALAGGGGVAGGLLGGGPNLPNFVRDIGQLLEADLERTVGQRSEVTGDLTNLLRDPASSGLFQLLAGPGTQAARSAGSRAQVGTRERATRAGITGSELQRLLTGAELEAESAAGAVAPNVLSGLLPMLLQLLTQPFGQQLLAGLAGPQIAGAFGESGRTQNFLQGIGGAGLLQVLDSLSDIFKKKETPATTVPFFAVPTGGG